MLRILMSKLAQGPDIITSRPKRVNKVVSAILSLHFRSPSPTWSGGRDAEPPPTWPAAPTVTRMLRLQFSQDADLKKRLRNRTAGENGATSSTHSIEQISRGLF